MNLLKKNIKITYRKNITGPYTEASKSISGNYWAEGPTAIKINGKWTVYFDKYRDKRYGAIQSKDLKKWKDISHEVEFPLGTRHGSVFKISLRGYEQILSHL